MKCPKCKSILIVSGQARLETMDEHILCTEPTLKDEYTCPNSDCICNNGVCWNADGERYGGYKLFSNDELGSPYGSFQRKMEIEVYKIGLKKETKLPSWLMLWFLKPHIGHNYEGDEDGNVLGKRYRLEISSSETPWRPFKKDSEFNISASFWIHTWKYLWRQYRRRDKLIKSYNRDFPYRAFEWFIGKIEKL